MADSSHAKMLTPNGISTTVQTKMSLVQT